MDKYILYIDDTSFNQSQKNSQTLKEEQVTYAGILIEENTQQYLNNIIDKLCNMLQTRFGTNEFHFTDIYNRKKPFEKIDFSETLDILETFASIITEFDIAIIPFTSRKNISDDQQQLLDLINFVSPTLRLPKDSKTQALLITTFKAKQFVETQLEDSELTKVICDEGIRKNGAIEKLNNSGLNLEFKSSSENKLLQLADFSAWFLTRAKNILDKASKNKSLSESDEAVLNIYSSLSDNYIGLSPISLDLGDLSSFDYDTTFKQNQ